MNLRISISKQQKMTLLAFSAVVVSVLSYVYFLKNPSLYQVQGISNMVLPNQNQPVQKKEFYTPIPSNTIIIGSDFSSQTRSQVLESAVSAPELINFYKNFFTMQNWSLLDESSQNGFYDLEFRQGVKQVKITISVSPSDVANKNVVPPVLINVQEIF